MAELKYPMKDFTSISHLGNRCYYIRIPIRLVKTGKFPVGNKQPLIITIESEDKIVITPLR